jgi:two-component system, OmpR family, response regulator
VRILVAEDDALLGDAIAEHLRSHGGHAVDWIRDGAAADAALRTEPFKLVVLDLGLPRVSGREVLSRMRKRASSIPVLIITAADAIADRVAGLDAGADDYVVKPFDTEELLARIRALIRRSAGHAEPVFSHKGVTLNPATREASVNGESVSLSAREWAVLEPMLLRPGAVFSRTQLEEKLYGWKEDISSNAVEVYIHGLRKKLGADLIQTVRGLGYVVPRL